MNLTEKEKKYDTTYWFHIYTAATHTNLGFRKTKVTE
jgi:hypothetical protein